MARTTPVAVLTLLGDNWDGITDVTQFIDTASAIVDDVVVSSASRLPPSMTLTPLKQELIERWLACHYYAQFDQLYAMKTTVGASATFQGQTTMSIESTRYGQSAINLDFSGTLSAISRRQFARGFWMGNRFGTGCSWCAWPSRW
jgi:hypothetical protein